MLSMPIYGGDASNNTEEIKIIIKELQKVIEAQLNRNNEAISSTIRYEIKQIITDNMQNTSYINRTRDLRLQHKLCKYILDFINSKNIEDLLSMDYNDMQVILMQQCQFNERSLVSKKSSALMLIELLSTHIPDLKPVLAKLEAFTKDDIFASMTDIKNDISSLNGAADEYEVEMASALLKKINYMNNMIKLTDSEIPIFETAKSKIKNLTAYLKRDFKNIELKLTSSMSQDEKTKEAIRYLELAVMPNRTEALPIAQDSMDLVSLAQIYNNLMKLSRNIYLCEAYYCERGRTDEELLARNTMKLIKTCTIKDANCKERLNCNPYSNDAGMNRMSVDLTIQQIQDIFNSPQFSEIIKPILDYKVKIHSEASCFINYGVYWAIMRHINTRLEFNKFQPLTILPDGDRIDTQQNLIAFVNNPDNFKETKVSK